MDESEVDFHHSTIALNEALTKFDFVHSEATFLLIVEKDSVFQRLLDEGWIEKFPKSILLTVLSTINFFLLSLGSRLSGHLHSILPKVACI